jgi:hypothetical protein
MVSTNWKVNNFFLLSNFNSYSLRAFVYLTNLCYGLPLVQKVAIVSEHGEIKGYLKIAIQKLQTSDSTNEQIKLMRTYRNASGMTKLAFDDETYFQVCLIVNKISIVKMNLFLLYKEID